MQLQQKSHYLSISKNSNIDGLHLPQFTVLTGVNGSGKTHFLSAINNGVIVCDNIPKEHTQMISYWDMLNFSQNDKALTNSIDGRCREFLSGEDAGRNWNNAIREIISKHLGPTFFDALTDTQLEYLSNTPLFKLERDQFPPDLWSMLVSVMSEINQKVFLDEEFKKFQYSRNIEESLRENGILNRDNGFSYYRIKGALQLAGLKQLTQTYNDYLKREQEYGQQQYDKGRDGSKEKYFKEFRRNFPSPWSITDQVLDELRSQFFEDDVFDFFVTNPETKDYSASNSVELYTIDGRRKIQIAQLSSGEKVVFHLLMLAVQIRAGNLPPEVLLLDEIDASLHPSMIKAMLTVIQMTFLDFGRSVIFATHSPTTVALADADSIFVVKRGDVEEKLSKTGRAQALSELTEGYASYEDLLLIGNSTKPHIVLSEGKNYVYLQKALELFGLQKDIEVLKLNIGSDAQLRTVFDLVRKLGSTKKLTFVWDCDYTKVPEKDENGQQLRDESGRKLYRDKCRSDLYRDATDACRAFIFEENADSSSSRGIENLFNEMDTSAFEGGFGENGPNNKRNFERWVMKNASRELFKNFKPLMEFLSK